MLLLIGHDPKSPWTYTHSGYIDEEKALGWLEHFHERTIRHTINSPYRMLLLDGHASHTRPAFISRCYELKIIPFCLPPHSTHLLQPLDVCVFGPYKHYHSIVVENGVRCGIYNFGKDDFLAAQPLIKKEAFKKSTIRSAFKKSGIFPLDPKKVLDRLRDWSEEDDHLTVEQEVHKMDAVWKPIDPYAPRGCINNIPVPPKTAAEIASDLAFNARESQLRQKLLEESECHVEDTIIIGERPHTPPLQMQPPLDRVVYATPSNPRQLELQQEELNKQLDGYFLHGEELSPSFRHLYKFSAKGSLSASYLAKIHRDELVETHKAQQRKTARGTCRKQVKFFGQITTEQACEQEMANEEMEREKVVRAEQRQINREIMQDNEILVKQWRAEEKEIQQVIKQRAQDMNREIREGNAYWGPLWRAEDEDARKIEVAESKAKRQANRPKKRVRTKK